MPAAGELEIISHQSHLVAVRSLYCRRSTRTHLEGDLRRDKTRPLLPPAAGNDIFLVHGMCTLRLFVNKRKWILRGRCRVALKLRG